MSKIIFIWISIVVISIIFFFFLKNSNDNSGPSSTKPKKKCSPDCKYGCDSNNNCLQPESPCGQKPSDLTCDEYICENNQWRCKTVCDNGQTVPQCYNNSLKCNTDQKSFYCEKDDRCSEKGYFYPLRQNKCDCNPGYIGALCEHSEIQNCTEYNLDYSCKICIPPFYGKDCNSSCKTNQHYNYTTNLCVCDDNYILDSNGNCVIKPNTPPCENDSITDPITGKCTCKSINKGSTVTNFYGNQCEKSITCHDQSEIVIDDSTGKAYCNCNKTSSCTTTTLCDTQNFCGKHGKIANSSSMLCSDATCNCDIGFEGMNCQCNIADKAKYGVPNKCLGQDLVCQKDGTYKIETKNTCNDIYKLINPSNPTHDNWVTSCINDPDINSQYCNGDKTHGHILNCVDDIKGSKLSCTQKCPITVPELCYNCPSGQTCNCHDTTGNNYVCLPQQNPKVCGTVPDTFCPPDHLGKVVTPACVQCGNSGHYENICPNNAPSRQCLQEMLNVKHNDKIGIWESNNIPIFPTIDNNICKNLTQNPTTFLQGDQEWTGYGRFNNPSGYIVDGVFSPINEAKYTFAFDTRIDNGVNCKWTDKDITTYLNDPESDQICRNRGTFTQDKDKNNGKGLQKGSCACSPYISDVTGKQTHYFGLNCQYNDKDTCNNHGTVMDNNGTCNCVSTYTSPVDGTTKNYFGKNCEKSDFDCKVVQDNKTLYGQYVNGICDYSNLCSTKFLHCNTCGNTSNYDTMKCLSCGNITCSPDTDCMRVAPNGIGLCCKKELICEMRDNSRVCCGDGSVCDTKNKICRKANPLDKTP